MLDQVSRDYFILAAAFIMTLRKYGLEAWVGRVNAIGLRKDHWE
jgi:hypothetical protein